jgi:hypothetical protein
LRRAFITIKRPGNSTFQIIITSIIMSSASSTLQYAAHLCAAPGRNQEYNTRIVFEMEELVLELANKPVIKPKLTVKLSEVPEDYGNDEMGHVIDQVLSMTEEEVPTINTDSKQSPQSKDSPDYFKHNVRKHVKARRDWNKGNELAYLYKAYFTPPRCRFSMIGLAADSIVAKMALEKTVNKQFADFWFRGILDIITNCVTIE